MRKEVQSTGVSECIVLVQIKASLKLLLFLLQLHSHFLMPLHCHSLPVHQMSPDFPTCPSHPSATSAAAHLFPHQSCRLLMPLTPVPAFTWGDVRGSSGMFYFLIVKLDDGKFTLTRQRRLTRVTTCCDLCSIHFTPGAHSLSCLHACLVWRGPNKPRSLRRCSLVYFREGEKTAAQKHCPVSERRSHAFIPRRCTNCVSNCARN